MERGKFVEAFNKASDQLDRKKLKKVMKRSNNAVDTQHNCVVVMEELSELSQQVSKAARGIIDKGGLIEEMGDVLLQIVSLQDMFDISTLDLYKAMNVKVDRLERVLNEKGVYL